MQSRAVMAITRALLFSLLLLGVSTKAYEVQVRTPAAWSAYNTLRSSNGRRWTNINGVSPTSIKINGVVFARRRGAVVAEASVDTSASTRRQDSSVEALPNSSRLWNWKHDGIWQVHYEVAGESGPPLLFIPGFGVGSFHFERNIEQLSRNHRVYCMDLLGQGKSWPKEIEAHHGLAFSVDTWRDQVQDFVREVIKEPTYLAGNSLGGLLAVGTAAHNEELVKGLILLNATPFWAFLPSRRRMPEWIKKMVPWDGTLPAPQHLFDIGAAYFEKMRDRKTVKQMLETVYASPQAFDDRLVEQIIAPTEHPFGHATFSSILFSPKPEHSFEEWLERVRCPLLLLYGREDPWVTPVWGQKVKRQVGGKALYVELSPVGHSPHHEAPTAVNTLIEEWIEAVEAQGDEEGPRLALPGVREFSEEVTGVTVTAKELDGAPRDWLEWLAATFFLKHD